MVQAALWNGTGGGGWVALQPLLDELFRPIDELLVASVSPGPGARVLDVGCGTGGTTVTVAQRWSAACTGIDVSEPMIAAARARAERTGVDVRFLVADAQQHRFEPASFDAVISRFGVMFFDDPVEAFAGLHRATRPSAPLRVVVWRDPEENPFMTAAERAAATLLPELPVRRANEPGQFGLAHSSHVREVLEQSGWSNVELRPLDAACSMPESALVPYLTQLGPVGRVLQQADDELRVRVVAAVRPAFEPYVHGEQVRFNAACWLVSARA